MTLCKRVNQNEPILFPSDEALKQKWICAIRRDDFVPTRHSKVSTCRKSAWHLEMWFHSENHYCCFYCCRFIVRLEKWFVGIKILFTSKKVDGDNKVHVIAAKRFKLFSLMVYSSQLKANVRIIYNIAYPKLFTQSDVTLTFF